MIGSFRCKKCETFIIETTSCLKDNDIKRKQNSFSIKNCVQGKQHKETFPKIWMSLVH